GGPERVEPGEGLPAVAEGQGFEEGGGHGAWRGGRGRGAVGPLCSGRGAVSWPADRGGPSTGTVRMSEFRIGKFQVLETLGTGAHSTILHIRRNEDSKHYALKVVPIGAPEDQKYLDQARH